MNGTENAYFPSVDKLVNIFNLFKTIHASLKLSICKTHYFPSNDVFGSFDTCFEMMTRILNYTLKSSFRFFPENEKKCSSWDNDCHIMKVSYKKGIDLFHI